MTVDEAAALEVRLKMVVDAARQIIEQDAADDWIVSDRGFRYRIVELT